MALMFELKELFFCFHRPLTAKIGIKDTRYGMMSSICIYFCNTAIPDIIL